MPDHHLERRAAGCRSAGIEEAGGVVQPDHAARLADGAELPVGQVARVRADRMGVGVGGNQRCVGKLRHIAESLLVEMRKVDLDLQPVAGLDQFLAGIGQPVAGIGRGGEAERHAVAEGVRPAPDDAERAQAGGVKHLQHGEIGVDRLGALDMEHGGELFLLHRGANVGGAAADIQSTGLFQPEQDRSHADRGIDGGGAR